MIAGWSCWLLLSAGPGGMFASIGGGAQPAECVQSRRPTSEATEHNPLITSEELERHVRVLASDAFEGRETGTRGGRRAAGYLAGILKKTGVEPAGDDGGFLQDVGLVKLVRESLPALAARGSGAVEQPLWGADYDLRPDLPLADTGWLRVVRVTSAEEMPAKVEPGVALFLDGSRRRREEWLAAVPAGERLDGEAGPATPGDVEHEADRKGTNWGLLLYPGSRRPGRVRSLGKAGLRPAPGDENPWLVPRGTLLEGLRSGAISELRLKSGLTLVPAGAANVVGILPGVGTAERPDLARETVVLSAHYDHLGLVGEGGHGGEQSSQDGEPDLVYNGADDDASGTAAVLELAGALAAADPPVRTVVFLLATGEEKGLLGTKYYLDHPAVPLADTIFNLNFEMIGRPDELAEGVGGLWLTGHGRTTMWAEAQEAGVELFADQRPNEHFFERSDNYAFVMRGILGQTLSSYNMHSDYHRVSDEADLLDYEHMELGVRRGLGLVRLLLSGELTPRWVPGGEPQRRRR